jgi:hypothetical protein
VAGGGAPDLAVQEQDDAGSGAGGDGKAPGGGDPGTDTGTTATAGTTTAGPGRASGRWWLALGAICLVAFGIRVGYTFGWQHLDTVAGDAYYYHHGANLLAEGHGFVHPYAWDDGVSMPGADHPPGYILALAVPSLVGLTKIIDHQIFSCLIGTGTVLLVGMAGRRIAGGRAGLIAAGLAAVYPAIWLNDAALMSETLALLCGVVVIIAAYRAWERPNPRRFVEVGLALGLATLARAEALMLVALLALPLAVWVPQLKGARERLGRLGLAVAATALVIVPWVAYNMARFQEPATLSTQMGPTLEAANCDDTYLGPAIGSWSVRCATQWGDRDRSVLDRVTRHKALDYIGDHTDRLPAVLTARVTRTFGLGHVDSQVHFDKFAEGRPLGASWAGVGMFYAVAVAAIGGAVILRRRGVPSFPLTSAVVNVLITVIVFYGSTRFRAPAEPALVLLGAVAIDALVGRLVRRAPEQAPDTAADQAPTPAPAA